MHKGSCHAEKRTSNSLNASNYTHFTLVSQKGDAETAETTSAVFNSHPQIVRDTLLVVEIER